MGTKPLIRGSLGDIQDAKVSGKVCLSLMVTMAENTVFLGDGTAMAMNPSPFSC